MQFDNLRVESASRICSTFGRAEHVKRELSSVLNKMRFQIGNAREVVSVVNGDGEATGTCSVFGS